MVNHGEVRGSATIIALPEPDTTIIALLLLGLNWYKSDVLSSDQPLWFAHAKHQYRSDDATPCIQTATCRYKQHLSSHTANADNPLTWQWSLALCTYALYCLHTHSPIFLTYKTCKDIRHILFHIVNESHIKSLQFPWISISKLTLIVDITTCFLSQSASTNYSILNNQFELIEFNQFRTEKVNLVHQAIRLYALETLERDHSGTTRMDHN